MSTAKKMAALVNAYHKSGESQKSFASTHGVSKGKLNYWIQKLSETEKDFAVDKSSSFMPIAITDSAKHTSSIGKVIIIRLAGGIEIEIPL